MHDICGYLGVFAAAVAAALLLTPPVRALARRAGIVDRPDPRRINRTPVPRGGGLAVFAAFHIALFAAGQLFADGATLGRLGHAWHPFFLTASGLLVLVGLLDDIFGLRPWPKLAGQIVVAMLLFGGGARVGAVFSFPVPEPLDCLLTVVWFVAIVNAFNLIDGMDGLSAGLAMIGSLGLAACLFTRGLVREALPLIALAGACLGFLRYNFHPATIFLGDCGSMFLGLVLADIPLRTSAKSELLASLGVPLLVLGVPLFDTVLAIWRRSVRAAMPELAGESRRAVRVMQADREHIHHRILARGLTQRAAALVLYAVSGILVAVAVTSLLFRTRSTGIVLLGFIIVACVLARQLSRVELWDTGRALLSTVRMPLSARLTVPLYIFLDLLSMALVWTWSRRLAGLPLSRHSLTAIAPLLMVPVMATIAASRAYQRTWTHARARDYAILVFAIFTGCLVGFALVILFDLREPGWSRQVAIFTLALPFPVVGVRMARELLAEGMAALARQRLLETPGAERVLAYGGGNRFLLFQREGATRIADQRRVIVGIVDDNINLRGRIVQGCRVLGSLADLPALARRHNVAGVVITARLDDARRAEIAAAARAAGIWLKEWKHDEEEIVPPPPEPAT
jgi:UDP-GlcNAc:undecaprenyl-phosphate GlcNAc-1-phosphate transferase